MIYLTKQQARPFILLKHGLLGEHKFMGKTLRNEIEKRLKRFVKFNGYSRIVIEAQKTE